MPQKRDSKVSKWSVSIEPSLKMNPLLYAPTKYIFMNIFQRYFDVEYEYSVKRSVYLLSPWHISVYMS